MAKSLRSKAKQHNKVVKRQSVFGEVAAARDQRIAERLHNAAIDDILANQESTGNKEPESMEVDKKEEAPKAPKVKKVVRVRGKKVPQTTGRKKSKLALSRKWELVSYIRHWNSIVLSRVGNRQLFIFF